MLLFAPTMSTNGEAHRTNFIEGWQVLVSEHLITDQKDPTDRAIKLLREQLQEIVRVVPAVAVAKLQKITLWFSPEYPGVAPKAEYHPGADWLREHGRDPAMARGVEFTNIRIFEAETKRMPNFALHELAHAYHDRFLPGGFDNPEIKVLFENAKKSGAYDLVERAFTDGRPNQRERAYAMTDPMEYFAEGSEAFFSRNDFFPFDRAQLKKHDPDLERLLTKFWGLSE